MIGGMRTLFSKLAIFFLIASFPYSCLAAKPTRWHTFKELISNDTEGVGQATGAFFSALFTLNFYALSEGGVRQSLDSADSGDFSAWYTLTSHVLCATTAGLCGYYVRGFVDRFEIYHTHRLNNYERRQGVAQTSEPN